MFFCLNTSLTRAGILASWLQLGTTGERASSISKTKHQGCRSSQKHQRVYALPTDLDHCSITLSQSQLCQHQDQLAGRPQHRGLKDCLFVASGCAMHVYLNCLPASSCQKQLDMGLHSGSSLHRTAKPVSTDYRASWPLGPFDKAVGHTAARCLPEWELDILSPQRARTDAGVLPLGWSDVK